MISDALEGASNENKVQITRHEFRVHGGPHNDLFVKVTRFGVQLSFLQQTAPYPHLPPKAFPLPGLKGA